MRNKPGQIRLYCKECIAYFHRKPNAVAEWSCDHCGNPLKLAPYTKLEDNQIEKAKRDLAELNQ